MGPVERALIFDVDGTLVDSNELHAEAWAESLHEFGIERDVETIVPLIGMGGDKLLPRLAGVTADHELGGQITARRVELLRTVYLERVKPFPNVRELFVRLLADGVRLGIASSTQKDELDELLTVAGVRDLLDPDVLTSSAEVRSSKPDPDAVVAALARLGTARGATLMVGDSPYDVEAARSAGLGVIALRCGGWVDRDLDGALAIYDDPKDLLRAYEAREWDWPAAPSRPGATFKMHPENTSLR